MTDYFDLHGKVALVTGGSRGLGYQMVKAFATHGADVFITSRKRDACDRVAAEVRAPRRWRRRRWRRRSSCSTASWR